MRVLFCGGGTGGHVYPALAVAEAIVRMEGGDERAERQGAALRRSPTAILYVGAEGQIEETLVPKAGLALETISGGGLHGVGLARLVPNMIRLMRGFFAAWRIVGRFRPDVLFLTGGYIGVPVALATWLRRRPILVFLPDVEPGRAIRALGRLATRVAVNVKASRRYLPSDKVVVTGYPLRSAFYQIASPVRRTARAHFGISETDKVLLVFGGSRGAQRINRALGAILEQVLVQAHVIHISGRFDAETCRMRRDILPPAAQARYHLFDYLHEIELAFAAADLVVARAGAATLAEFPFFGLPAILVPYPFAWRYQKVNADYLAEQGAAIRLNDEDMREQLWPTIEALFKDEARLNHMGEQARALARPDAAGRLADLVAEMAHRP